MRKYQIKDLINVIISLGSPHTNVLIISQKFSWQDVSLVKIYASLSFYSIKIQLRNLANECAKIM